MGVSKNQAPLKTSNGRALGIRKTRQQDPFTEAAIEDEIKETILGQTSQG